MGSLSSKPKAAEEDWKPHATLQYCVEELTDMWDGLSSRKEGEVFILSKDGETAEGSTVCDALIKLKILRERNT